MVAAAAAIVVIWLIAGCSTSGSGPSPKPASSDTISGAALTAAGSPVSGVAVGFQLTTASCSSCDIYKTVTDSSGQYKLHLPAGTYQAQCVAAAGLTCLIASSPPEGALRLQRRRERKPQPPHRHPDTAHHAKPDTAAHHAKPDTAHHAKPNRRRTRRAVTWLAGTS